MKASKTIDYLFEDPPIPNQKFALVSIVGPHMPQKCNIWGLKVRGVAESMEKAKSMTQRLMKIDNNYDIYTVELGKFFPLEVEPHQVGDVEYENQQLNDLIKSYLENREHANEQWLQRKNEMIKEAIREGKNQQEMASRPEHPVAVLQRIQSYNDQIRETQEMLQSLQEDLERSQEKYNSYTDEERELANKELESVVKQVTENEQTNSVEELREQLIDELRVDTLSNDANLDSTLVKIQNLEQELEELNVLKTTTSHLPAVYRRTISQINELEHQLSDLKKSLENTRNVNDFINSHYNGSQYDYLQN